MKMLRRWFSLSPSPTCVQRRSEKGYALKDQTSSPSESSSSELPPKITKEDWELVLRLIGETGRPEVEDEAMIVDSADDKGVKLEDFEGFSSLGEEEMRGAFAVFDVDGDGKISAEELRGVFLSLGDEGCTLEDCQKMISVVAPRGGGFVCFEDFDRMMACKRSV